MNLKRTETFKDLPMVIFAVPGSSVIPSNETLLKFGWTVPFLEDAVLSLIDDVDCMEVILQITIYLNLIQ